MLSTGSIYKAVSPPIGQSIAVKMCTPSKRERVYAALEGRPIDQVPLSLWRNFHKQNQTPKGLAKATVTFYKQYNFDLIKLTPDIFYAVKDWGAKIAYSKDDDQPSRLKQPVINSPEDWRHLKTLPLSEGSYGRTLKAIKLVTNRLVKENIPVLMTSVNHNGMSLFGLFLFVIESAVL